MDVWPIGVFTSIDAGLGVRLEVAHEIGVPTIQIHTPHKNSRTPEKAKSFLKQIADMGIQLTCVFGGFDGESYADIPTVEKTVGLIPKETRQARLAEMKEISDFASLLECNVIGLHLGFIPHSDAGKPYEQILNVTRELCQHAENNGQNIHLETGQETAEGLVNFLDDAACSNLFVNFDPANMILYGTGEPIGALKLIGDRVRSVHCKDAKWADNPGKEWGEETPLGKGDVGIREYLTTLKEIGYRGPLTIEREIPQDPARQKAEVVHAVDVLSGIRAELFPE